MHENVPYIKFGGRCQEFFTHQSYQLCYFKKLWNRLHYKFYLNPTISADTFGPYFQYGLFYLILVDGLALSFFPVRSGSRFCIKIHNIILTENYYILKYESIIYMDSYSSKVLNFITYKIESFNTVMFVDHFFQNGM